MRPRTKRQVRVNELRAELLPLNQKVKAWAFKNCIEHVGYRNKMWTSCLCCGHVWPTTSMRIKTEKCEGCGWKLKIDTTRKQKLRDYARFAILEVVEDFQVIRYFEIDCHMKAKTKAEPWICEILQHWILPTGEFEIISRVVGGMGLPYDHFGGELTLRDRKNLWKYSTSVYKIHPDSKVWPILKRNGFTTKMTDLNLFKLIQCLPTEARLETLIKTKQLALASAYLGDRAGSIDRYWPSVKISIRSGYNVKDAITWLDYLSLLDWFVKDLRNSKYVCPTNLKKEHDRYVKKREEATNRQKLEQRKRQAEQDQIEYQRTKAMFFGLAFKENDLEVKVLEHVNEFIAEAEAHKHCVFAARYFAKPESLIFSARVAGKPVETVEVSLKEGKIVQSRGLHNRATDYNEQIVELVSKNMNTIMRLSQKTEVAV